MFAPLSVVVFTVLAGAGQGLVVLTALWALTGELGRGLGGVALAVSLALMALGLSSSALHLGRPERAWRAFTQWRSSWLAREAWTALGCWLAAAAFAALWAIGAPAPVALALGLIAAALALVSAYCTARIYASVAAIPHWRSRWTAPVYLLLALQSGAVLLALLTNALDANRPSLDLVAATLTLIAALAKLAYWRDGDRAPQGFDAAAASGLGAFGRVRLIWPPGGDNAFVQKEMVRRLSFRHIRAWRRGVLAALFLMPGAFDLAAASCAQPASAWGAAAAAATLALGLFAERWLFFREIRHACAVYYAPERGIGRSAPS